MHLFEWHKNVLSMTHIGEKIIEGKKKTFFVSLVLNCDKKMIILQDISIT